MKQDTAISTNLVARLFGVSQSHVRVEAESIHVGSLSFPIDRGVVLLDEAVVRKNAIPGTKDDVRHSFSEEWKVYSALLPEHDAEFAAYFDLIDLSSLNERVVLDLGCGSGRWSEKIAPFCEAVVLVDFSDAIFVAKNNLSEIENALFFRGDITDLPFVDDCADLLFSLGVLHHLDRPCLPVAEELMRFAPRGLFYLYYDLDNRPIYFQWVLTWVTKMRTLLTRIRSESVRRFVSKVIAVCIYKPMVMLGQFTEFLRLDIAVPLSEGYRGKSVRRIEQDAYDRFFTSIEQRVSRVEITSFFESKFSVEVSDDEPYWHFELMRRA